MDAQVEPYNYIRTAGRALTADEKLHAGIPANIDYTFMLTPSLTGGYYWLCPHQQLLDICGSLWWA